MVEIKKFKEEISKDEDNKVEYQEIKLSHLIRSVVELKAIIMSNKYNRRDELYNRLNYLECELVRLKDNNITLDNDWWRRE